MIKIIRINWKNKKELKVFLKFAWKIYENDQNWVPPLMYDMKNRFNPKFSFFDFGEIQLFVAEKDGKLVGRIAAIKNDLYNQVHKDKTGFFGYFECIDDQSVANSLFDAAKAWLIEKDLNIMHGPASPSSNHDYGLLVEGFDDSPRFMMTYNPQYYISLITNYGFKKTMGLLAYKMKKENVMDNKKMTRVANIAKERFGLKIRPVNMNKIKEEVQHVKHIWNEAWEHNYGFVPLSDKEVDELAEDIKPIAEPSLILYGEIDNKVIGIAIAVLDFNYIFKPMNGKLFPFNFLRILLSKYRLFDRYTKIKEIKWMRIIVLGILPKYQRKGIDAAFYKTIIENGFKLNIEYAEASWILEDNDMMNKGMQVVNGEIYKRYNVYEVAI